MTDMLRPTEPEKLDLRSHDIAEDRRQTLLRLFPEVRTEGGKVDFERLKLALGDAVDVGKERYGLTWPGKADCFKTIQAPSLGTLRPAREESVNFDTTENLVIEGDNLEVLKLLQKSYLGKIKIVYIDPPYNTGNDFIYPDNYSESLQTYLQYTKQTDDSGRRFGTNSDTDGRFHSKWINMMYTRLYVARHMLRSDGFIFVSIDDNEVDNLRLLCNEIFGESNFVALITWLRKKESSNDNKGFSVKGEYIVCYARSEAATIYPLPLSLDYVASSYNDPTPEMPDGRWRPVPIAVSRGHQGGGYEYTITTPSGKEISRKWLCPPETYREYEVRGRLYFGKFGDGVPQRVMYEHESRGVPPDNVWITVATNKDGKKEIVDLFDADVYDTPKPSALIRRLIEISTRPTDSSVVLDFFSGSGSTAQAVLDLNARDSGSRRFVLVQLPEPTGRTDYPTIADIMKERVRRVIKKLDEADAGKLPLDREQKQDRGFRVFKLAESNFKPWDAEIEHDAAQLQRQLELHVDHIREGRTAEDILYEILLKSGFPLTTPVETVELAGKQVYSVAGGALLLCLERELTLELIRAIAEQQPERVVCLDEGFAGNDQLKANAVQTFKTAGVASFRTV